MKKRDNVKTVVRNRKARHDYIIEEVIEAGIALIGTEVKSLRMGRASLQDSYAQLVGNEVFLRNAHIDQYEPAARFNHDPLRPRRLLLHKREIRRLASRVAQKGYTLVPLSIYFRDGKAKVEPPRPGRNLMINGSLSGKGTLSVKPGGRLGAGIGSIEERHLSRLAICCQFDGYVIELLTQQLDCMSSGGESGST